VQEKERKTYQNEFDNKQTGLPGEAYLEKKYYIQCSTMNSSYIG
jgi:hypothetical protein